MDNSVFWIIVLLILAALAFYAIRHYRHSSSVEINTPVGSAKISGQNEPGQLPPSTGNSINQSVTDSTGVAQSAGGGSSSKVTQTVSGSRNVAQSAGGSKASVKTDKSEE